MRDFPGKPTADGVVTLEAFIQGDANVARQWVVGGPTACGSRARPRHVTCSCARITCTKLDSLAVYIPSSASTGTIPASRALAARVSRACAGLRLPHRGGMLRDLGKDVSKILEYMPGSGSIIMPCPEVVLRVR